MSYARLTHVVLALILLGAVSALAQTFPAAEVACPRAAFKPVLDGRLDDWPRLPQLVLTGAEDWHPAAAQFAEYGGPQDISGSVRLAWDNQALYLALEIRDDVLVRVRSAAEIDRGDSVVLSLAEKGSNQVHQFVVALLKGASLVWRAEPAGAAGEVKTIARAVWARPDEEGGSRVTYELAIPWSELEPIRPLPGKELTLVVSVCDDDGQGLKGCLEHPISVILSAGGMAALGPLIGPPRPPSLPPIFPAPEAARFDQKCFTLRGRDTLLFAGQIDYAHLPREVWPDRLASLKAAGLKAVAVTVPWSHHRPTPEDADLAELRAFLELCKASDLWVLLHLGPYAGENWESGGLPAWAAAGPTPEQERKAVAGWYHALLPVVAEYQASAGGPIACVLVRGLLGGGNRASGDLWEWLFGLLSSAGIKVPILTINAPAARDNTRQPLASMLDTLSFYTPPTPDAVASRLQALAREENGPPVIAALPGDYRSPASARSSLDVVKVALGNGAGAITLSDFAPGLSSLALEGPGDRSSAGIINPAGARTAGYGEARLVAGFLDQFGAQLARAMPAEGLVQPDDPGVQAVARLSNQEGFIFLWDQGGEAAHHVRLTYLEPGTEATVSIPQAGAIDLPPGGAKILAMDVPLGRGLLRYTTSEIAGIYRVGDRTILMLYGDPETPGEIALKWPGPPLVLGEVARQQWDPETKTLTLDYYHGRSDRYLLVDEIEIALLSRSRAAFAGAIAGEGGAAVLSAGARIAEGSFNSNGLKVVLECSPGAVQVSAALPRAPSLVTVDGQPVAASFASPERVATFQITTESFEQSQRPSSLWDRLGRAVLGGPPGLRASFDRVWFMPDAAAPEGPWTPMESLDVLPYNLGLSLGRFARLRARFEGRASAKVVISGPSDPALVFVNGQFVPGLSGSAPVRRADITPLLLAGEDNMEIILHLLPRGAASTLPKVTLTGDEGQVIPCKWEFSAGLRGEAAGWEGPGAEVSRWHLLRLGPWREQGREVAEIRGVGWYRVPFALPQPEDWRIPYHLHLAMSGAANLYLNGVHLATCQGDGDYVLPLPTPPLRQGEENVLALALYGLEPQTGLQRLEIAAEEERMGRRRVLGIRF